MTYDGRYDEEPTDKKSLENLQDVKRATYEETLADLANQTFWVASGHTLKDGGLNPKVPKNNYFKNQGGK